MASPGMMNRRVQLVKPAPKEADSFGEMTAQGQPQRFDVWASWKDSGGGEVLSDQQEYGVTTITSDIWWHTAINDIDTEWILVGEDRVEYDIVAAEELGGRRWQIRLKLVRRQ